MQKATSHKLFQNPIKIGRIGDIDILVNISVFCSISFSIICIRISISYIIGIGMDQFLKSIYCLWLSETCRHTGTQRADVEIVVDPGSLAPRNYLSWQK